MGKVVVTAQVDNLEDLFKVEQRTLSDDQVRRVVVQDAVVDTGAMMLGLPRRLVQQLGLKTVRRRRIRTANGLTDANVCQPVRLTVQGRDFTGDVLELVDDCPVLIGQIPLEALDFVVDPVGQRLIGNPEHGGEQMIDVF